MTKNTTISVGFGDETESNSENIEKTEALAELLENKKIGRLTIELSPEDLRKLLHESANYLTGVPSEDPAIIVPLKIKTGEKPWIVKLFP